MTNSKDKNLREISQELWNVKTENEVINMLSDAIKYISDTLILNQEKLSQEDQFKMDVLLQKLKWLKDVFQKYAEFFVKNKDKIKALIEFKDNIEILQDNVYFSSESIKITDYFSKLQKDLLEVLGYTDTFFSINNFSGAENNSFQTLFDVIEKRKTKQEKLITLRNEVTNIEAFILRLEKRFQKIEDFHRHFDDKIKKISSEIQDLFSESIATFFWKVTTWNVSFVYADNLALTLLFEDIFSRLPKTNHSIKTFLENIIQLAKSKNYTMIQNKTLITPWDYENFLEIFKLYEKLYEVHFSLQSEISTLKSELNEFTSGQVFLNPKDISEQEVKKLKVFSSGKQNFLHEIKDLKLNGSHIFDDIKLEKKSVGNGGLITLKKEIFSKLFSLMEYIQNQEIETSQLQNLTMEDIENISKKKKNQELTPTEKLIQKVLEISKLYSKFLSEKKQLHSRWASEEIEWKKSTFHYKPVLGEYGVIEKFEEVLTDEIVAKTIGKTADEIRAMVSNILSRDQFAHILESFPGNSGSLEWNYIILWPWWWGKTALIKEMSQNPNIATVEIGKADIVDKRVWATEKNIKAMYELSAKIHRQTKKHVFIFIDEVDALLAPISTTSWGINIQKEIQTMLDGVHAYPGVHTIMLSNKPHGIPIDIYRRMEKTFVLADLDLKEKVELVHSRIDRYNLSEELQRFLTWLSHYYPNIEFLLNTGFEQSHIEDYLEEHDFARVKEISQKDPKVLLDLYLEKTLQITDKKLKENIARMYMITPKILWQVTERVFKNYIARFSHKDLLKLEKQLSKLKDKTNGEKVHKIFTQFENTITLEHFFEAMNQVFSNASTQSEIAGNIKFYKNVDQMMKMISSSAFDWVDDDEKPRRMLNIQIID